LESSLLALFNALFFIDIAQYMGLRLYIPPPSPTTTNEPINKPTNEPVNEPTNELVNEPVNEPTLLSHSYYNQPIPSIQQRSRGSGLYARRSRPTRRGRIQRTSRRPTRNQQQQQALPSSNEQHSLNELPTFTRQPIFIRLSTTDSSGAFHTFYRHTIQGSLEDFFNGTTGCFWFFNRYSDWFLDPTNQPFFEETPDPEITNLEIVE
jgi:hypothetical protein